MEERQGRIPDIGGKFLCRRGVIGGGTNSPGAGATEKEKGGCGRVNGFHREGVGGNERGDSRGRSEAGDKSGPIGILLCVLKEGGTDRKAAIGGATNESRGHSFCFRARGGNRRRKR